MMTRKKYTLDELLAQCDPGARIPKEMIDWESAAPTGLEQTEMLSQADIREAILTFGECVSKEFEVIQLVLFGSRANGEYRADSETNVAVLMRGKPGELEAIVDRKLALASLAYDVLLLTGVRIQPYPVWEAEWLAPERSQSVDSELVKRIAREGIVIWQT